MKVKRYFYRNSIIYDKITCDINKEKLYEKKRQRKNDENNGARNSNYICY